MRRRALLAASVSSTVPKPTFPVVLNIYSNNGQTGIALYNYIISKVPTGTAIPIPNTEYDIGVITVDGWGNISRCYILTNKTIVMSNQFMEEEGLTPSLNANGFLG